MPKRKSAKSKLPAPLAMLIEDHKKVRKLFKEFAKLDSDDDDQKRQIGEKTCQELTIHAQLEEEVFYPAIRKELADEENEMVDEAEVEHSVAKQLIAQLEGTDPSDPQYGATYKVLSEYVGHHIEEEETELFKEVKRTDIDFEKLAQEMRQRKQALMQKYGAMEEASGNRSKSQSDADAKRMRAAQRA